MASVIFVPSLRPLRFNFTAEITKGAQSDTEFYSFKYNLALLFIIRLLRQPPDRR